MKPGNLLVPVQARCYFLQDDVLKDKDVKPMHRYPLSDMEEVFYIFYVLIMFLS
ncbi:hypothetical protein ADA01nite_07820 [Aneurinibacillus danicus]|uniref:Uncharacterized protein n=1 Tax=Aneurinibacillus danicus TaxID=267746 RepID=A0A511V804_9BACL|nr:hypothetical protein ADA01nite_07820 [Aneurinibacillus danicus]